MSNPTGQFQRRLGLASAISITVGAVIGSGIFLKPLIVSQSLPSPTWIFALWALLGLVCLCGALAYAELGALFPQAGGQYVFLREAWGPQVAFLYGWVFFWAINSGTLAALATAFADYALPLFASHMPNSASEATLTTATASAMILFLALVNHYGVKFGALLQNVSTLAKLGSLGLILAGGLWVEGSVADTMPWQSNNPPNVSTGGWLTAFIGIFWAYEGWYQLPFNAAELKHPKRMLPLGLIAGMAILILAYVGMNAIYLRMVPFDEMRGLPAGAGQQVPYLTVARIFSTPVADYLSLLVAISILGAANPNLLCSTRAFYAMGEDGLAPKSLQQIHPRHGTPSVAIWTQAAWAVVLVVYLQNFHDITAFVVFESFLFYGLTVAAVYRLRHTRPELPRPYLCGGYPYTPALFILASLGFATTLLLDDKGRHQALVGLAILVTGIPYYLWQQARGKHLSTLP